MARQAAQLLAFDGLLLLIVGGPLLLIQHIWGMDRHWIVSALVWIAVTAVVHIFVLPHYGLTLNYGPTLPW